MTLLQLVYLGLSIIMTLILFGMGFNAMNQTFEGETLKRKKVLLVIGLSIWHIYLFLVAKSGFIQDLSFPPRFALTMILPAFIFTGIFITKNRNNAWITKIPTSHLFFFQSFRILVESLFALSFIEGLLHKEVTIHGYNFDMIYAITVLIVGFIAFRSKTPNLKLIKAWNYLGLLVIASIIFVFMTTIYAPGLYGADAPLMPIEATQYPYVLIAGYLMPVAVFIHVLSIAQLNRMRKKSK